MTKTWVLSAHRAGACLYEQEVRGAALHMLEEVSHPEGRLRDQDLNSDRFGRAFESHGYGRRAMDTEQRPHERVAADFARILAESVDRSRAAGHFDRLLIVAEPTMLGLLRQALPDATAKYLDGTIDKEFRAGEQAGLESALTRAELIELPEG